MSVTRTKPDVGSMCLCVCVFFSVIPLSSFIIPVRVKRVKTRREKMIVSASSSVNGDILARHTCVQMMKVFVFKYTLAPAQSTPIPHRIKPRNSTYPEYVTGAVRYWSSHSSFITHTVSLSSSVSLCQTLSRAVKSRLSSPLKFKWDHINHNY